MGMRRVVAAGIALAFLVLPCSASAQSRPVKLPRQGDQPSGDSKGDDRGGQRCGPVKWWQDEKFKTELRLSSDQSARIDAIFETTFPKLRASYEELGRREDQLSSLISANDATEAAVLRQADQVEAIRTELSKTRVLMLFRIRRVLSPEQRDKLQQMQKDRDRERGGPPRH